MFYFDVNLTLILFCFVCFIASVFIHILPLNSDPWCGELLNATEPQLTLHAGRICCRFKSVLLVCKIPCRRINRAFFFLFLLAA